MGLATVSFTWQHTHTHTIHLKGPQQLLMGLAMGIWVWVGVWVSASVSVSVYNNTNDGNNQPNLCALPTDLLTSFRLIPPQNLNSKTRFGFQLFWLSVFGFRFSVFSFDFSFMCIISYVNFSYFFFLVVVFFFFIISQTGFLKWGNRSKREEN